MSSSVLVSNATLPNQSRPNFALYYPGYQWHSLNWIKNMLLFFDGIALLVPKHPSGTETLDIDTASYLKEKDLLKILEPETIVNKAATENLAKCVTELIRSGALDLLLNNRESRFAELSYSRLGGYADREVTDSIVELLKEKGLAHTPKRSGAVPLHEDVRSILLVLLSQIVASQGAELGLDLSPSTDIPDYVGALRELLSVPGYPSSGNVVSLDLESVGVDLENVPFDDIIAYREEHFDQYRSYARSVRKYVHELSHMTEEQRQAISEDRIQEIKDMALDLKKTARQAWNQRIAFALGIAGAAWTMHTGDIIGAFITAAATTFGYATQQNADIGAYTYIFKLQDLS